MKVLIPPQAKVAIAVFVAVAGLFLCLVVAATGGSPAAQGSQPAANSTLTCVAGAGLRPGSVPNGWDIDVAAASAASGVAAPILAAQLDAESSWNPTAKSPAGASGLAQFMPATWAAYGQGSITDPHDAIKAQGTYMGVLMNDVKSIADAGGHDQVSLALAAYNAGPGAVAKHNGIPPYKETQDYVAKIAKNAQTTFSGDCSSQTSNDPSVVEALLTGTWVSPLPGGILTSTFAMRWGSMHWGIDLAIAGGQVTAPTTLTITWSGDKGDGYGTSVVGRTTDGSDVQMRFGHCVAGSATVTAGQPAAAGTKLCDMGMTGDSTGPHLHFEVYKPGAGQNAYASSCSCAVDPLPILTSKGMTF